jgi:hypothetical protein
MLASSGWAKAVSGWGELTELAAAVFTFFAMLPFFLRRSNGRRFYGNIIHLGLPFFLEFLTAF